MADLLPHLGAALVAACVILTLARRLTSIRMILSGVFIAIFAVILMPLGEFPASHYLRVLTGDLSMLSLVWLTAGAGQTMLHGRRTRSAHERHSAIAVLFIALCLYPSALGLSPLDVYSLGYSPVYLGPVVFLLFAGTIGLNYWIPAISAALALAAYYLGFLESNNLWDYLIDPVIVIYCLSLLVMDRRQLLSSDEHEPAKA